MQNGFLSDHNFFEDLRPKFLEGFASRYILSFSFRDPLFVAEPSGVTPERGTSQITYLDFDLVPYQSPNQLLLTSRRQLQLPRCMRLGISEAEQWRTYSRHLIKAVRLTQSTYLYVINPRSLCGKGFNKDETQLS